MYNDIKQQSTLRLIEVRELLDFIQSETPKPPKVEPKNILIAKGLFFPHLYGAYEYTVKATVAKSIDLINFKKHRINDCRPPFLALVLNSELDSIASVGDKKWEKRHALFNTMLLNSEVEIPIDLMPTNGRNLRYRQLESIWKSFSVAAPIVPRQELRGRIEELVTNRNAIAHGTESAARIGSLNTINELYIKYAAINEMCSYIIQVFEDYISNENYLQVKQT